MKIYKDKDIDPAALADARIAVIGYGSQGRAHALNLKDSGYDVVVGVRQDGAGWKQAHHDGLQVAEPAGAVDGAAEVDPDFAAFLEYNAAARGEATFEVGLEMLFTSLATTFGLERSGT